MNRKLNVLILGASYGALAGCKLALAGHSVTLVCTTLTAKLINKRGVVVRFPLRGRDSLAVVNTNLLEGRVDACIPTDVDVQKYDLVVLGMQEPQYQSPQVKVLMTRIARAHKPCVAIMNMPPLAYMRRLPGVNADALSDCYADARLWNQFEPELVTVASPDPQAFRPADSEKNVLQVSLPTNFKVARLASDTHTDMLRMIERDIQQARHEHLGMQIELPVKVRVHESLYVPLAKWGMLMTGNYRCVTRNGMMPICDAVHGDLELSEAIYDWTASLCKSLGADSTDLVPFEKYAKAALGLVQPSSAAKALSQGAQAIERVDRLVQSLAKQRGLSHPVVQRIVGNVDWYLDRNTDMTRQSRVAIAG